MYQALENVQEKKEKKMYKTIWKAQLKQFPGRLVGCQEIPQLLLQHFHAHSTWGSEKP